MKSTLVAVGRLRDPSYKALCAVYTKRLGRFAPFEIKEVKAARGLEGLMAKRGESAGILKHLPKGVWAVSTGPGLRAREIKISDFKFFEIASTAKAITKFIA